jgi:folate-binding protein YgfZ
MVNLSDPGYAAVQTGAGFFDRLDRGTLALTGADRAAWLNGLVTNDIGALTPGTGCYAAHLTPQGRLITDMTVLALEDRLLIDLPGETKDRLAARFDQLIFMEDVHVEDMTDRWTAFGLHGPGSADIIGSSADERAPRLDSLHEHQHVWIRIAGAAVLVVATRELQKTGFNLYGDRERGSRLREILATSGARPVGAEALEVLRVEAGRPRFHVDMAEDTIPLEAGIEDRAISFTKGCYVGQEVIIRVLHRGHGRVARRLMGLIESRSNREGLRTQVPSAITAGDLVFAGDREVGRVTSAARSPRFGHTIALAYVHRDLATPGAGVEVAKGEGRIPMTVAALPFADAA